MQHIRSGIGHLFCREFRRTPIRRLLLLGQIHAQQFPAQILEPMPIRKSPHQLGSDFGANHRRRDNTQRMIQRRHIKPREMKQLGDRRIRQQLLQIGRIRTPPTKRCRADLHQMRGPIARR